MKHVIYMIRLCQGLEISAAITTAESYALGMMLMAGWLEGLLINKSIYRKFGNVAVLRFNMDYVNYLNPYKYFFVLHNQHLRGAADDDVITAISAVFEL